MTVYVVAQIAIHDRAEYGRYEAGFADAFMKHGGRIVSVDDQPEVVEGDWAHDRSVVIEFEDKAAMRAWYDSPEYQAIIGHRHAASSANIILVNGFPT